MTCFAEHDDTLRLTGEVSDDGAGYAVAWTGDMDGGGSPELLIGAPFESSGADGAGAAYLVYGETALAERSSMVLSEADLKLVGEANLDYSGIALTGAGDVDGDGLADVAISSYYNDSGGDTAGAVYVVLGATAAVAASPLSLSDADLQLLGESSGDMAGLSLAGPGDVDGDGLDDLLLAAPYENTGGDAAGAVYLAHGATLAGLSGPTDLSSVDLKFIGESSGAMAGGSLAGPGDVGADGLMDLFIGSPEGDDYGDDDAGAAYLVSGAAAAAAAGTQDLAVATLKLTGEHYDDNAGSSVAGAGDVNADGYADLAITAPSASYAGLGYVVLGGGY